MKISHYYSLYNLIRNNRNFITRGCEIARSMGMRYRLVRMDTNWLCNLRCKTCYFSAPDASKLNIPPMKIDFFKTIAESVFPQTRILYLSCGAEPFMTKGFEKFLDVVGQYNIPSTGYATNGLLFNEEIISASISNGIKEITISIDGATKPTYEFIREGGNFDKLLSKLSLFKEMVIKAKSRNPYLKFNFVVSRSNHHEMPALIDLAKEYNVKVIRVRIFRDWGGTFTFERESLVGHERSFNDSLEEAKRRASKFGIQLLAPKGFSYGAGEKPVLKYDENKYIPSTPCIYPWFYRYIDPRGKIRVCQHLPLSSENINGKYTMKDFENSEEERRRKDLLKTSPSDGCFKHVCDGAPLNWVDDDVNFIKTQRHLFSGPAVG